MTTLTSFAVDNTSGTVAENILRGRYDPETNVTELVPDVDEFLQSQVVSCLGKAPTAQTDADSAATPASGAESAYRKVVGLVEDEGDIELGMDKKVEVESDEVPEDLLAASKLSHAHSFVSTFPQGYHTEVGEGSIMISGGQKQRIAIARAIVKQPHILLLDEATSALDAASERLVQESIDSLQSMNTHTSIIIAHRLTTIKSADTIVVMDRGQVVESGSHEELLQLDQLYAKLWHRQQGTRDQTSAEAGRLREEQATAARVLQDMQ